MAAPHRWRLPIREDRVAIGAGRRANGIPMDLRASRGLSEGSAPMDQHRHCPWTVRKQCRSARPRARTQGVATLRDWQSRSKDGAVAEWAGKEESRSAALAFHALWRGKGVIEERSFRKPLRQRGICAKRSANGDADGLPWVRARGRALLNGLHAERLRSIG